MDGEYTWIHSDHLHSATILTDEDGHDIRRLAYRAFGEELENTGSGAEPTYSYTGKEMDKSGLMYYGARYYDPALSRFITTDTVYDRGPQGLNRYAYALNNPIRNNDPSGHLAIVPREDVSVGVVTDEDVLRETDEYLGYGPKLQEDPQSSVKRYIDDAVGNFWGTVLGADENILTGESLSEYDRAEVFIIVPARP